jgi:VanZ family protein
MDKMLHVAAYGVMAILFYRAFQTLRLRHNPRMLMLLSILSASLYGISDEIHQYFVPFREADIFDGIADIIGAVCGVYFYRLWLRRKQAAG